MYVLFTSTFPYLALFIGLRANESRKGLMIDPHAPKTRAPILASTNIIIKVRFKSYLSLYTPVLRVKLTNSEFTTFPLPPAYSPRVRSALNASSSSVRLSNLVGGNGWWYRWGRRIADVYVSLRCPLSIRKRMLTYRLDDQPQADLLAMLLRVRSHMFKDEETATG